MNWFKKRKSDKKTKKDATDGNVKKGRAPKKSKHQKKAPLSYTALEPFVDSLFGQNGFTTDYDDNQVGVVLVLPFSELGGLTVSKADKRNQSKGTFVTSINKGDFEVYYDEVQDEAEQLVILVNTESIDTLADFSVVKDAEYRWAYFTRSGEVIETDYVSTMEELIEHRTDLESYFESIFEEDSVSDSNSNLDNDSDSTNDDGSELDELDGLSGLSDIDGSGDGFNQIDEPVDTSDSIDADDNSSEMVETDNIDDPSIVDTFEEPNFFGSNDFDGDLTGDHDFDNDAPAFDDNQDDEVYSDHAYDEELMLDGETVDSDRVDEIFNQVLFQNDLDLVLPVDRYRELYMASSDDYLIPYYENDGTWLTAEANRLIHEANDDIRRRILSDGDVAHATYVRLLNDLSVRTAELFDLNGDNQYVDLITNASDLRNENRVHAEAKILEYIAQKEAEYNERRDAKGDEAKANAMNVYDNQHRDKFDRQMAEYRRSELNAIESLHADSVVEIKQSRRLAAQTYFETGSAKILSELGKHYIELREAQKEYSNAWGDKLLQFLDDNRAQDIARVEVLQRQLESDERFTKIQNESDAEIKRLTQSFESQVALIKANTEAELERAGRQIKSLEEDKSRLAKERDALDSRTSADYKDLNERYQAVNQELTAAKTKAALADIQQSQLAQRDREIEDWKSQVEIVSKSNDRNKVAFLCVSIVAVVAALLIGLIAGAQLF